MYIDISIKDSISSIFTEKAFLIYVPGQSLRAPSGTEIENSIVKMTPEERRLLIPMAKMVATYAQAVEQAAAKYS
jgi:hypothetical protein